jgi:hypothetical protein
MTHRFCTTVLAWIAVGLTPDCVQAADFNYNFKKAFTVSPASGWKFYTGNFIGDSLQEIAAYNSNDGSVYVASRDTFTGSYSFHKYATVTPAAGWKFVPGQFADDGSGRTLDDLFAYHPSDGSVWVGRNTGSSFNFIHWNTIGTGNAWNFSAGYFKGDDVYSDGVAYHPSDGSVWVMRNRLDSFKTTVWGYITPASGWTIVGTGNYTGPSSGGDKSDVVLYRPADGQIMVGQGISSSSSFFFMLFAKMESGIDWSFATLKRQQFTGFDTFDRLVGYHYPTGTLWIGSNVFGTSFRFSKVSANHLPVGPKWRLVTGLFDFKNSQGALNHNNNILAFNPGTGAVWIGEAIY